MTIKFGNNSVWDREDLLTVSKSEENNPSIDHPTPAVKPETPTDLQYRVVPA